MEITLKYGNHFKTCTFSENISIRTLTPKSATRIINLKKLLVDTIESPIGADSLPSLLSINKRILIVIPDKTRQCRIDLILPLLLSYLNSKGIYQNNITILIANGTHGLQNDKETINLIGEEVFRNYKILQNNSRYNNSYEMVGTTSSGTPIEINKTVLNSDLTITVGGILHHYLAGYGGGPKLIIPGVASYNTAKMNHRLTIDKEGSIHNECRAGNIDTNPMYRDICEGIRMVSNVFSINLILNHQNEILRVFAGDPIFSHREGAKVASQLFEVPIDEQSDVVLVSVGGAPRDSTFIQSHKALHYAFFATKPGGTILAVAACYDGIGSDTFLQWFEIPYEKMGEKLLEAYTLNGQTALSLRNKLQMVKIHLLSQLGKNTVESMGLHPETDFLQGIENIVKDNYFGSTIYLIPEGGITLPMLSG